MPPMADSLDWSALQALFERYRSGDPQAALGLQLLGFQQGLGELEGLLEEVDEVEQELLKLIRFASLLDLYQLPALMARLNLHLSH